jgi:hypothetical protein
VDSSQFAAGDFTSHNRGGVEAVRARLAQVPLDLVRQLLKKLLVDTQLTANPLTSAFVGGAGALHCCIQVVDIQLQLVGEVLEGAELFSAGGDVVEKPYSSSVISAKAAT